MSTIKIEKFLGLNMDNTGTTNLKIGELSKCTNIRITENYKAQKRNGYVKFPFTSINKKIRGIWNGSLRNVNYLVFVTGDQIIGYNLDTQVYEFFGTITENNYDVNMFQFNDKLYFQSGADYMFWDGFFFRTVFGYRPKVFIGTPPAGGGTAFEGINLLNGAKRQTFSADGAATTYQLAEKEINSVDFVKVNGVEKTVTTDYTVNLTNGTVTFISPPSTGQDNVEIGWTKGTGDRTQIEYCRAALVYGGANDTRVFLYGNIAHKNRRYYSGLADGVPSAEYFPANNYSDVGSDEYEITSIVRQYDRQIIFKENNTYYSTIETINNIVTFPVYPLNDSKGNKAFNQVRIIQNNPYSIIEGVYMWTSTNVRDERNAKYISSRIQTGLDELNLSNAVTWDYEFKGEYWICVGQRVYIYNYRIDVWYSFVLNHTPTCFTEIDGVLYFGTDTGDVMKFDNSMLYDALRPSDGVGLVGKPIEATLETGFLDFGENWKRKFLNFAWIGLQPEIRSQALISWQSDYSTSQEPEEIFYNLVNFENVFFEDYTFDVNYNPQPFRLKFKAKKFTYLKIIIENSSMDERMTILNITLPALIGGMSK